MSIMTWIIQIQTECINIGFTVFCAADIVRHCLQKYSTYYVKLQPIGPTEQRIYIKNI